MDRHVVAVFPLLLLSSGGGMVHRRRRIPLQ